MAGEGKSEQKPAPPPSASPPLQKESVDDEYGNAEDIWIETPYIAPPTDPSLFAMHSPGEGLLRPARDILDLDEMDDSNDHLLKNSSEDDNIADNSGDSSNEFIASLEDIEMGFGSLDLDEIVNQYHFTVSTDGGISEDTSKPVVSKNSGNLISDDQKPSTVELTSPKPLSSKTATKQSPREKATKDQNLLDKPLNVSSPNKSLVISPPVTYSVNSESERKGNTYNPTILRGPQPITLVRLELGWTAPKAKRSTKRSAGRLREDRDYETSERAGYPQNHFFKESSTRPLRVFNVPGGVVPSSRKSEGSGRQIPGSGTRNSTRSNNSPSYAASLPRLVFWTSKTYKEDTLVQPPPKLPTTPPPASSLVGQASRTAGLGLNFPTEVQHLTKVRVNYGPLTVPRFLARPRALESPDGGSVPGTQGPPTKMERFINRFPNFVKSQVSEQDIPAQTSNNDEDISDDEGPLKQESGDIEAARPISPTHPQHTTEEKTKSRLPDTSYLSEDRVKSMQLIKTLTATRPEKETGSASTKRAKRHGGIALSPAKVRQADKHEPYSGKDENFDRGRRLSGTLRGDNHYEPDEGEDPEVCIMPVIPTVPGLRTTSSDIDANQRVLPPSLGLNSLLSLDHRMKESL